MAADPVVSSVIAHASTLIGSDLFDLETEDSLRRTYAVQLCTFTAAVAANTALERFGIVPDVVAGLSVGVFAAAVICGAMRFETALEMVMMRARLMEEERPHGYGLSAILGLSEPQVLDAIRSYNSLQTRVFIASVNAPSEIVIAGDNEALSQVCAHARRLGALSVKRLKTAVPSHCPLLAETARRLRLQLAQTELLTPRMPYMSSVRGSILTEPKAILEDLAASIERPVRWYEGIAGLFERGIRLYIEMPPGNKLSNLITQQWGEARSIAVESNSLEHIADIVIYLQEQLNTF